MKRILVATDFSQGAENAIHYAKQVAKATSQPLVYFHIVNLPIIDPLINSTAVSEALTDIEADAESKLKEMVAATKEEGIDSEYKISFEDFVYALNEITNLSLVVIGKTGHRTFLDKLIGSTAENLINHIKQPLLVIPDDFHGELFQQLCYASKFEFDENKYIAQALEWKKHSSKDLIIGHIHEEFPLDLVADHQFVTAIDEEFNQQGYVYENLKSTFYREGLSNMISQLGVSLLFITTQKRGFLEGLINPSKTKAVINNTSIPALVFSYES